MLQQKRIPYQIKDQSFEGYAVWDDAFSGPRPAVLVAHAWRGQDPFARGKAEELARLGYVGFAADLYGVGKQATNNEEAFALMSPLFKDRKELQTRITTALEIMKQLPQVDPKRCGAIGFCFGGLTVLELLRSGADVRGIVSFHGLMGDALSGLRATRAPAARDMKGAILFLHGHDDPSVSGEDIALLQKELTEAKVDWQMNIYGHTAHAFTNPEAHDVELGLIYQPRTATRAWQEMVRFLNEIFT